MNTAATWRVGIDLGGTSLRLLGESENGERSEVTTVPTARDYEDLLNQIESLLNSVVAGPILSIGCGICGTLDGTRPVFVPALPWIEGRPLRDDLAELSDASVVLGLDGHYALLAEAAEGSAIGHDSAVLVAVGTGIGGAIMLAGKIWRGERGTAGSLGWLSALGGKDDAKHGLFEQVASGTALSQAAHVYRPGWTGENLVTAARAGDTGAAAVADRFGRHLGRGLAALASVLDPEMIIIAGGLCDAMDVLSPSIDRAMRECASPNGRHVPVRAAAFGPHAGVVGALLATKLDKEIWL